MAQGRGRSPWRGSALSLLLLFGTAHAAEQAPLVGEASRGAALFSGASAFRNGGPPCGACHAAGGRGALLAASLGPELSQSFDGMPPEAIDGLLQDLPFPTMAPIYAGHALTPEERADLSAYLASITGVPPPRANAIAGTATGIGALFLLALALRARRRKPPTRSTLTARPPAPARRPTIGRPLEDRGASAVNARTAQGGRR